MCKRCGSRLYYHERVAWPQELCRPCSLELGIDRLCDRLVNRREQKAKP